MQNEVYWPTKKVVDMGNRKVTGVRVNKRVMLPDPRPAGRKVQMRKISGPHQLSQDQAMR